MASIQERAATFLAQGLKPTQVASIIGVTPARLSQLSKEDQWAEIYAKACEAHGMTPADEAAAALINNRYAALEAKIIDSIDANITVMEPRDQIKALDVVATRQERVQARLRAAQLGHGNTIQQTVVQISIPAHAMPEYQVNERSEIVSVDGKAMAPLGAHGVRTLFAGLKNNTDGLQPQVVSQELPKVEILDPSDSTLNTGPQGLEDF